MYITYGANMYSQTLSPILFVYCFPEGRKRGGKEKKRKSLWRKEYIVEIFFNFFFLIFVVWGWGRGGFSSLNIPAYNNCISEDIWSVFVFEVKVFNNFFLTAV